MYTVSPFMLSPSLVTTTLGMTLSALVNDSVGSMDWYWPAVISVCACVASGLKSCTLSCACCGIDCTVPAGAPRKKGPLAVLPLPAACPWALTSPRLDAVCAQTAGLHTSAAARAMRRGRKREMFGEADTSWTPGMGLVGMCKAQAAHS